MSYIFGLQGKWHGLGAITSIHSLVGVVPYEGNPRVEVGDMESIRQLVQPSYPQQYQYLAPSDFAARTQRCCTATSHC